MGEIPPDVNATVDKNGIICHSLSFFQYPEPRAHPTEELAHLVPG